MDADAFSIHLSQPALFDLAQTSAHALELFPAVWSAAEGLVAPESGTRHAALDCLQELDAARISPLVTYLLTTRLADPDLLLRARVIHILGDLLGPDAQGTFVPEGVLRYLKVALETMSAPGILALFQSLEYQPSLETHVARLLNACPHAAIRLSEIFLDRNLPLGLRRRAVELTGKVGYLDAIASLERLAARLEARQGGQQLMPFAPPSAPEEASLLPAIHQALLALRAP